MTSALLLYFVLFVAAAFVWPTIRIWRRERVNAWVLPHDDSVHGVVAIWFRGLIVAFFVLLVAIAAGFPVEALGALTWLHRPAVRIAGWALLLGSLVWIMIAQRQMGRSWRIGIDRGEQPPLVRHGLFGRSRNPIFLGVRLTLAGFVLVLPNAATLCLWLLGEVLIQVQVRLEEAHLRARFGEDYDLYRRAVPRWL